MKKIILLLLLCTNVSAIDYTKKDQHDVTYPTKHEFQFTQADLEVIAKYYIENAYKVPIGDDIKLDWYCNFFYTQHSNSTISSKVEECTLSVNVTEKIK